MFDSGTLQALRADVHARVSRAGLDIHRVEEIVLAIHELAANAIKHGAGAGRLRIWDLAGTLRCQVDDGPRALDDPAPGTDPGEVKATEAQSPSGTSVVSRWATPGHGLWVVQQVADQLRITSTPRGTSATVTFNPAAGA